MKLFPCCYCFHRLPVCVCECVSVCVCVCVCFFQLSLLNFSTTSIWKGGSTLCLHFKWFLKWKSSLSSVCVGTNNLIKVRTSRLPLWFKVGMQMCVPSSLGVFPWQPKTPLLNKTSAMKLRYIIQSDGPNSQKHLDLRIQIWNTLLIPEVAHILEEKKI